MLDTIRAVTAHIWPLVSDFSSEVPHVKFYETTILTTLALYASQKRLQLCSNIRDVRVNFPDEMKNPTCKCQ